MVNMLPAPTEEEAKAYFMPKERYNLGCHFASLVIDTFLMGIMTMQVLNYIKASRKDSIITKLTVAWSFCWCIAVTCYVWHFAQYLFVQGFGHYTQFFETKYLSWFPTMDSLHVSVVQLFLGYRAFLLLCRNWYIFIVIICLICVHLGAAFATTAKFLTIPSELDAHLIDVQVLIWLSGTVACDVVITVGIMMGLLRSRTGFKHTDTQVMRIAQMTFEAQLPPTLLAIAFLIEFKIDPANLLGATFQAVNAKIYGVGLLFALNSRDGFNRDWSMQERSAANAFNLSTRNHQRTEIIVETATYIEDDKKTSSRDGKDDDSVNTFELQQPDSSSRTQLNHPQQPKFSNRDIV